MLGGSSADAAPRILKCNGCWSMVDSKEHSVVTTCGHLYCLNCCQTIMESDDPTCPICSQLISKSNIKATHVLSPPSGMVLVLAGQTPQCVMEVALNAIEYWNRQQALYAEAAQVTSTRKIAKTQDQCRKKLSEVHNGYLTAKRKYQEILAQKHALQQDNQELQDKYNQKAMQDRKLKESFARLQQENEALRRQLAGQQMGGGGGGGMGMGRMMGLGGGGGGGGGSGRASRMGVLGMEDAMMRRAPTVLAPRAAQHDPSPLASMLGAPVALVGPAGGAYIFHTPDNPPTAMRQLHASGTGVGGGRLGGGMVGLGGGGGTRQQMVMTNDKRQAMGFNAPHNSMNTM